MTETKTNFMRLQSAFSYQLPGQKAQLKMAPPGRSLVVEEKKRAFLRQSAVLLLLWEEEDELCIALTVRPDSMRNHPSQISFPGGGYELRDQNLLETALRETEEEIGVSRDQFTVVGKLTPLYVSVSNYCIQPYVAFAKAKPSFKRNKDEVAEILTIPLVWFQDSANLSSFYTKTKTGKLLVPSYPLGEKQLWGATAMILTELIELLDR